MVDTNPTDPTAYTTQPLQAPPARLATREELCGPIRPSAPLTDDEVAVLVAPDAPLSADEIAEMRRALAERDAATTVYEFQQIGCWIVAEFPRLLSALEALTAFRTDALDTLRAIGLALGLPDPLAADAPSAPPPEWSGKLSDKVAALTAENERLTAYSRHQYSLGHEAAAVEIGGEIDVLKAEVERLTSALKVANANHEHFEREWYLACDKVDALTAELCEERAQRLTDLGQAMQPECYVDADPGWYTRHRAAVEAAHAAAKQAKREAECRNCRDGFPAYINPADWNTCPDCGKRFGAAKEAAE